ncbi:MAG: zinc ribbon domain-containing protein [Proteobacteria bacterium]|nr:zinc ribbon domain-containing protein [Pseudomonadota bacterium]
MRIVSEELWDKVQARYAAVALGPQNPRPESQRRPVRLLSGLTRCGICGGALIIGGAEGRLVCSTRRERGASACSNGRSVKSAQIETRTADAIRGFLLEPAVVEAAILEFQATSKARRAEERSHRVRLESELAEAKRRAGRLVDQVADGILTGAAVKDRLMALEADRTRLEAELAQQPDDPVVELHPGVAKRYRELVERLELVLASPASADAVAAREAFRALIRSVVVTPLEAQCQFDVRIETEMAALLAQDGHIVSVGAGTGFEPVTFRL